MEDSLRGKLLIATPSLFDFFRRSVVLILEHTEEGAFGLVLNRRSEATVGEVLPALAELTDPSDPVWIGGPVNPQSVVIIGEFADPSLSSKLVVGDVGVVDLDDPDPELGRVRGYAGHSGWGAGQLEDELERDAWLVQDADPEDPFREEDLWAEVLQRRGGEFALLASMPDDPSMN